MKRVKAVNGYTIYEAAARDAVKYGYEAGCFYVPLDEQMPRERLERIVRTVSPRFILTDQKNLTAAEIVEVLDAIHLQWIEDNFTAKRWAEKYFKGQLPQYRKTSRIDWTEVVKDLLFMQKYLIAGGSEVSVEEIEAAFGEYVADDTAEDDIPAIKARAMTLAEEIIPQMEAFKLKAKPEIAAKVKAFLEEHQNPDEIMRIMVSSI